MTKKAIDLKTLASSTGGNVDDVSRTISATGPALLWTDRMAIGQKEGMKPIKGQQ